MEAEIEIVIRMSPREAKELAGELDDILTDYDGTAEVDRCKEFVSFIYDHVGV